MRMTLQCVVADKCVSTTTSILPNELEIVIECLVDNKLSLQNINYTISIKVEISFK